MDNEWNFNCAIQLEWTYIVLIFIKVFFVLKLLLIQRGNKTEHVFALFLLLFLFDMIVARKLHFLMYFYNINILFVPYDEYIGKQ